MDFTIASTGTSSPSGTTIIFDIPRTVVDQVTGSMEMQTLVYSAIPEKDMSERKKIAAFVRGGDYQKPGWKMETDLTAQHAVKLLADAGGSPTQMGQLGDFLDGKINKSKSKTETEIGGRLGTETVGITGKRKKTRETV